MSELVECRSLLQEIDERQNEVIEQLDQLNARAERLIKEALACRDLESSVPSEIG